MSDPRSIPIPAKDQDDFDFGVGLNRALQLGRVRFIEVVSERSGESAITIGLLTKDVVSLQQRLQDKGIESAPGEPDYPGELRIRRNSIEKLLAIWPEPGRTYVSNGLELKRALHSVVEGDKLTSLGDLGYAIGGDNLQRISELLNKFGIAHKRGEILSNHAEPQQAIHLLKKDIDASKPFFPIQLLWEMVPLLPHGSTYQERNLSAEEVVVPSPSGAAHHRGADSFTGPTEVANDTPLTEQERADFEQLLASASVPRTPMKTEYHPSLWVIIAVKGDYAPAEFAALGMNPKALQCSSSAGNTVVRIPFSEVRAALAKEMQQDTATSQLNNPLATLGGGAKLMGRTAPPSPDAGRGRGGRPSTIQTGRRTAAPVGGND